MASSRQQQQRAIQRIISSSTSTPTTSNTISSSNNTINNHTNAAPALISPPHQDEIRASHNPSQQDSRVGHSDELVTTLMKEDLENNLDALKESDLEALSSLERDLPVELNFLLRQHAVCIARVNCLERQIRELKESKQSTPAVPIPNTSSNSTINQITKSNHNHHHHLRLANTNPPPTTTATNPARIKNGNFIPSDDSGGEYSRATISDDDELSSLLDQIAKSIKPEPQNLGNITSNQPHRPNYSVITSQPQQYAFINPNQLHHHAVPVFVMGSPIAMAHPSSINSSVLPGVHFQPEARYNQYYEDLYVQNNNSTASPNTHKHNGIRPQQFDSSISAIEQLVSQKEKQQIDLQLKSADKWLKMRSSGLCNLNENYSNMNGRGGVKYGTAGGEVNGTTNGRNHHAASSVSATMVTDNFNNLIEENRSR